MSLPSPNLDDRSFDDLVEEAKHYVSQRCQQWTDFNASDPGITLLELMAWLTETTLYRLNRVPEKNFIAFLGLIGVKLEPATPARAWVTFTVDPSQKMPGTLKAGARCSTIPQGGVAALKFETLEDAPLTPRQLIAVDGGGGYMTSKDQGDPNPLRPASTALFEIFPAAVNKGRFEKTDRTPKVMHDLYLGDEQLEKLDAASRRALHIDFKLERHPPRGLVLDWEAWDGQSWERIVPRSDHTLGLKQDGRVTFDDLPTVLGGFSVTQLKTTAIKPAEGPAGKGVPRWLRARLEGSQSDDVPTILGIQRSVEIPKDTPRLPRLVFASHEDVESGDPKVKIRIPPLRVEPTQEIIPFGHQPHHGYFCHLESSIFSFREGTVGIAFEGVRSGPNKDYSIVWEYFAKDQKWKPLAASDETQNLTKSGDVTFKVPLDIAPTSLQGAEGWFLRFGIAALGPKPEERNLAPFRIRSMLLRYAEAPGPWQHIAYDNYGELEEVSNVAAAFRPFHLIGDKDAAFYLALDEVPQPEDVNTFFFDVKSPFGDKDVELRDVTTYYKPLVSWEYRAAEEWLPLIVPEDGTHSFTRTGIVKFKCPADGVKTRARGGAKVAGFWLRALLKAAPYEYNPSLRRILLNTVEAEQVETIEDKDLGDSTGDAHQVFSLNTFLLKNPSLSIREMSQDEVKRRNVAEPKWESWIRVESFRESGKDDRHFTVDLRTGTFEFGDGTRGKKLQPGWKIRCDRYQQCAGEMGNVGEGTITVLETESKSIRAVTNWISAGAGADAESVEDAKRKGPAAIKHRGRAVTHDDFEALARDASRLVARAKCWADQGIVHVIVIPHGSIEDDTPFPSQYLLRDVSTFLQERSIINTEVRVDGPKYVKILFDITVLVRPQYVTRFQEVKSRIDTELRCFFHPIRGGPDDKGWPMGRDVYLSEIYYSLERLEGVEVIRDLKMWRYDSPDEKAAQQSVIEEGAVILEATELPCVAQSMKIRQSMEST